MPQYTFHTDPGLTAALYKAFGWSRYDGAVFTMIQAGASGQTISLAFDGGHRLNVQVTETRPGVLALDWSATGPKPSAPEAAAIGYALEAFLVRINLIGANVPAIH